MTLFRYVVERHDKWMPRDLMHYAACLACRGRIVGPAKPGRICRVVERDGKRLFVVEHRYFTVPA